MKPQTILAALFLALSAFAAQAKPNILLVIADDMGKDASLCYNLGSQQAPMPNLEAMCARGMVFENAYATPMCSSTRATILTGQYGFRTGVGTAVSPRQQNGLSSNITSLFDVLATTDYSTNLIGKWHLSDDTQNFEHPAQFGVSDYFGLFTGGLKDYSDWTAISNGKQVNITNYATTEFTDRAIDWISNQANPWFLWLAYTAPHSPFHIPPSDLHDFDHLPNNATAIRENPLPYYNAMLQALDTEIGRLMMSMTPEVRNNTIVVFIGDNGSPNQVTRGFFGDHGAKGTIYDSGTNVPMVVSGAGVKAGRSDSFVTTTDMFKTIATLAGATADSPDSYDFSPMLTGGDGDRDYIYTEHFSGQQPRGRAVLGWALRQDDYKLIVEDGKDPALYDLASDPKEANDLLADGTSSKEQKIVTSLQDRYREIQ
jgi:arylsulfatase A-like enzyme